MPTLSIEMSVMLRREQMPFTCGSTSAVTDEMTVPLISGASVLRMNSGMACGRSGEIQRGCRTELPAEASSWASS
jgi:hypothetical protein